MRSGGAPWSSLASFSLSHSQIVSTALSLGLSFPHPPELTDGISGAQNFRENVVSL